MNMNFERKLTIPQETKEMYPRTEEMARIYDDRNNQLCEILSGKDDRFVMIVGPCSADNMDSVLDYTSRLRELAEEVKNEIFIIPRIYTNKPRTTGLGYKGMLHQPDATGKPDMYKGILAIRELHMRVIQETGFTSADELLYTENYKYLDDILGYVAIGARSVEDQQHRLTASAIEVPVGMKNPTSGDYSVMMNAITAAQNEHTFIYRGWEGHSYGNPFAHSILRGYVDKRGVAHPNYHYEDLLRLDEFYKKNPNLTNPAAIIDTNHSNSGKQPMEQPRIIREILQNRRLNNEVKKLVKGVMVESYIEDGSQPVDGGVYGKSITDPCLGWDKTQRLIYNVAEML